MSSTATDPAPCELAKRTFVIASVLLVACGGSDDHPDAMIIQPVDAAIDAPLPCLAQPTYGAVTPANQEAFRDADTTPDIIFYKSALNLDVKVDDLWIELWKGSGAYETGEIVAGAVALTGPEVNYATCGACVLIDVDVDPDTGREGTLLATGGTLNLTSVSPNIKGTLSNVTLTQVLIDDETSESTPAGNDCNATVTSIAFDFPVTTEMAFRAKRHGKRR
jgi:hypothetical protein